MGAEKLRELDIWTEKSFQIKHHSYVDIIGLLKALPQWFNSMGYDFYEKGLAEKDIGSGDQIESEWVASKEVTEYIQYKMEIAIVAKDVRKVILEDGEQVYWARLLITFKTTFVKDFQKKYDEEKLHEKFMREFYERYIVSEDLRKYIGKLVVESLDLTGVMKSYLK